MVLCSKCSRQDSHGFPPELTKETSVLWQVLRHWWTELLKHLWSSETLFQLFPPHFLYTEDWEVLIIGTVSVRLTKFEIWCSFQVNQWSQKLHGTEWIELLSAGLKHPLGSTALPHFLHCYRFCASLQGHKAKGIFSPYLLTDPFIFLSLQIKFTSHIWARQYPRLWIFVWLCVGIFSLFCPNVPIIMLVPDSFNLMGTCC